MLRGLLQQKSGSAAATIDENGLLSAGTANGVVTVKATSKENAEISGTCEITVAIPDVTAQSESSRTARMSELQESEDHME